MVTIEFWTDRTSDPESPRLIVSREDADGSVTLKAFADEDYKEYCAAKGYACEVAKREGVFAYEVGEDGSRELLYDPEGEGL